MYPTYYVIIYTEKENGETIGKSQPNTRYNSIEEAEKELKSKGFTKVGRRDWYSDLNTGGIASVEAHIQWKEAR